MATASAYIKTGLSSVGQSRLVTIFKIKELRQKIFITLLFLAIYRIGFHVPLPMIDQVRDGRSACAAPTRACSASSRCSPAAASARARIFGLGIMPYISASIIFQLLASVYPPLEKLQKEGEAGRKKINEYTRYATVRHLPHPGLDLGARTSPGRERQAACGLAIAGLRHASSTSSPSVLTMTAGTVFLMWIGEQIDEYGIGNGISLIIMAGIVARIPDATDSSALRARRPASSSRSSRSAAAARGDIGLEKLLVLVVPVRRRRRRRHRHHQGPAAHPDAVGQARPRPARLRRHPAVPAAAGQPGRRHAGHLRQQPAASCRPSSSSGSAQTFDWPTGRTSSTSAFERQGYLYNVFYIVLIYFFCYFWTAITFNPKDMANNLKDYGSFIPGYRPGKRTADYLEKVHDADHLRRGGVPRGHRHHPEPDLDGAGRRLPRSPASTAAPAC